MTLDTDVKHPIDLGRPWRLVETLRKNKDMFQLMFFHGLDMFPLIFNRKTASGGRGHLRVFRGKIVEKHLLMVFKSVLDGL